MNGQIEGQEMNEPFSEKELLKMLSRLDDLTRKASVITAAAHRVNDELVLIQRELYQRLKPLVRDRNDTHV